MSSSTRSMSRVTATMLTSGCWWMPRTTAGCSLRESSLRRSATPLPTAATSATRLGRVLAPMTVAAMPSDVGEPAHRLNQVLLPPRAGTPTSSG